MLDAKRYIILLTTRVAPYATPFQRAELVAWGTAGAARAETTYDRSRSKFLTYATPFILGAIRDALNRERWHGRLNRAARTLVRQIEHDTVETDVSWESEEQTRARLDARSARFMLMAITNLAAELPNPEQLLTDAETDRIALAAVAEAIACLSEFHRAIFTMRYVHDQEFVPIAVALGVDESTVRRHHEKLLDAVHCVLHERGIRELPQWRP